MNHNVSAVILAGGKGTRLSPLTQDTPKPMINVLGKPVIEYVFDALCKTSVSKAYVTTMYLPWQIEALGRRYKNLELAYVREKNPLGTAGGVKNALSDEKSADAYIILSGDGIFDFDLQKAIDFHFEKNADVTIVSYKTENPLSYGVILYDSDGRINRFTEKPPWSQVVSGTVNTGIYIVNKDIIDAIPKDTEFDFANQLFPLLLAEKRALFAYEAAGTWHDIGNLDEYFAANRSCLDGIISGAKNDGYTESELYEKGIDAESPVYVSKNAIIGKNVKIGAYSVIESGAVISDGCDVSCSIIGEHTSCGMGCGIYGAIIGKKVKIGENCVISEGCAIGGSAEINDCVILPKYSFINSARSIDSKD
ncbi:MAG: NDP-sugar synthase, partial [Clostridiales bacterium]|nr:NDP-sugar synthase [Clostridiales bacterium]